jgi:ABC-type nitrate/sulfonate/bicarbonate transport system substrate-binding protein
MAANLKAGHLQGYCAGEPWNSAAVVAQTGWVVATSAELAPEHPEKVMMVKRSFAEKSEGEHLALISALIEACEYCDRQENREHLIEVLADPSFVGAPESVIRASLGGTFDFGNARVERASDFHVFSRGGANEPTMQHAAWVIRGLHASGLLPDVTVMPIGKASEWFRADIFNQASKSLITATAVSAI